MAIFSIFSKSAATARRNQPHRTLVDLSAIKCIRDRALDHVVEREKNLKPAINLKNLIISDPTKTVPLTTISERRQSLEILTRPIDFIRSYPSVFEEFLPDAAGVVPHVRLTPEAVELDSEEKLMFESDSYKQQVADRLVKILMLNRNHKVPMSLVDRIKWDLGLPNDYLDSVIPQFPDYFHVVGSGDDRFLELVCWIDELAVSAMEKNGMKAEKEGLYLGEYMKGMPIEFQVEYSEDFEMDKKYKKWLDNWQKLPYISPYQNASHLSSSSDESDKWAVGILHELLHLLVPKKSEKDTLLCFGEYMGLRPRIKRAMLQHPGIFYMSSKLGTHTIVLREAYKRNVLIDKHVLMNMRSQYIHLMNTSKHVSKQQSVEQKKKQLARDVNGKGEQEQNGEDIDSFYSSSSEDEDEDDIDDDDDDEDDDEEEIQQKKQKGVNFIKSNLEHEKPFKKHNQEKYTHVFSERNETNKHLKDSRRIGKDREKNTYGRSSEGFNSSQSRERHMVNGTGDRKDDTRTTSARSGKMSSREGVVRNNSFSVKSSGISEFDRRRPFSDRNETNKHLKDSRRIGNDREKNTYGRSSKGFNSSQSRERHMVNGTGDHKDDTRTTSARSGKMSSRQGLERNNSISVKSSGISEFDRRKPFYNKTEGQTDVHTRQSTRTNSPRSRGNPVYGGTGRDVDMNIRSNSTRGSPSRDSRRST
ncbi:unnamed protein product [Rhodiola kirilowii]